MPGAWKLGRRKHEAAMDGVHAGKGNPASLRGDPAFLTTLRSAGWCCCTAGCGGRILIETMPGSRSVLAASALRRAFTCCRPSGSVS